jgi:hypothetical protein
MPCPPQVSTPALSATPTTLRAQLQKLQAQEEEAERLRAKLVGKVELLREEAAALRGLDTEKRQLEEQVGAGWEHCALAEAACAVPKLCAMGVGGAVLVAVCDARCFGQPLICGQCR